MDRGLIVHEHRKRDVLAHCGGDLLDDEVNPMGLEQPIVGRHELGCRPALGDDGLLG